MTDPTATPWFGAAGFPDQVINPSSLAITATPSTTSCALAWTAPVSVEYYNVYCGAFPVALPFIKTKLAPTATSFTITGLTTASIYFAQVVAVMADGSSLSSPVTEFTTT